MLMRHMSPRFVIAASLYFLSGMTGLAYEVLWLRMLGNQFGASQFGVVVTVGAFMLGLGIGALLVNHCLSTVRRPFLFFALLELAIAIHALLLPQLADGMTPMIAFIGAGLSSGAWMLAQVIAMVMVLLLPAVAMGASFPVIIRAASGSGGHLGVLYGLNACGAAIGALLPLVLLPWLGWATSLQSMAVVGISIALIAGLASCRFDEPGTESPAPARPTGQSRLALSWLAYATIGMAAIMLEVAWSRFFSLLMLRTEYVMAIILAIYVGGIGLGGLLGQRLPVRRSLDLIPLLLLILITAGLATTLAMTAWFEGQQYDSLPEAMFYQGGILVLLTMPVTLLLGAWLPLLHRLPGEASMAGLKLYAFNAIGSAAGALLAGFVLIPLLGTTAVICLSALVLLLAGLYWVQRWRVVLGVALLPLLAMILLWPFPPVSRLLPVSQSDSRDLYRFEDALAVTHVVERDDGQRLLLSDLQRMDAASDPAAVASQKDQTRLATWLLPEARSILFLGLGTGVTAAAALDDGAARRLTAVELSQGAITAARDWFVPVNAGVLTQMEVIHDDARRYLLVGRQRYDLIIGDLFHPDLVGRAALLSLQQFQRVRERLRDGGLYIQWLALNQFDYDSLTTILRTFVRAFPEARLFVDGFRLAMVGPASGWRGLPVSSWPVEVARPTAVDQPEDGWTWAGRYWGWPSLPAGPLENEWQPQIEYSLPQARYSGQVDLGRLLQWLARQRPPLTDAASAFALDEPLRRRYERSYLATSLVMRSWQEGLAGRTARADRLLRFAQQANPADRWIAWTLADRLLLSMPEAVARGMSERQVIERILTIMPGHPQALADLWRLERREGNPAQAARLLEQLRRVDPLGYRTLETNG